MVYQHFCKNCGKALSLTDKECPNCGDKVFYNIIDDDLIFNPPIHTIGFFNFDIDFSPFIKTSRKDFNYYLCSNCGHVNNITNDFCFYCGEKRKKSRFNRIFGIFSNNDSKIGNTVCPNCNNINLMDSVFCEFCGESLVEEEVKEESEKDKRYSNYNLIYDESIFCFCGEENDLEASFCSKCGLPLYQLNYQPKNMKILCTCNTYNDIKNEFCENCGIRLDFENEVLICSCGSQSSLNTKICRNCERPLNPQKSIKTRLICTCGHIIDYNTEFCPNCGKHISKSIKRSKNISKAKDSFKSLKRKLL